MMGLVTIHETADRPGVNKMEQSFLSPVVAPEVEGALHVARSKRTSELKYKMTHLRCKSMHSPDFATILQVFW